MDKKDLEVTAVRTPSRKSVRTAGGWPTDGGRQDEWLTSAVDAGDVGKTVEADDVLVDGEGHVYCVPTPTTDAADPLNWSWRRKWLILAILTLWSSAALSIQAFLLNFVPSVEARYPEASAHQVNLLLTVIMPMIAPGQLIFTPLAIAYGRRLSLLLANALLLASCLWGAFAPTYGSLLAARVVEGLAAGPTDCLVYVYVQEMAFMHERGRMMGVLMAAQLVVQLGMSIATNYMAVTIGFRVPFLMFAAIAGATLIAMLLWLPESRYHRPTPEADPNNPDAHVVLRLRVDDYPAFRRECVLAGAGKPWTLYQKLRPWSPKVRGASEHSVRWFVMRMARYALSPSMWWIAGLNTIMCGSLMAAQTYYAVMLVAPPWSWPEQNVGLINIGPAILAVVNWFVMGWGNDQVLLWLARRNGGHSRPEHRLVPLLFPVVTGVASSIGYGALMQHYLVTAPGGHQPHWFSLVAVYSINYQAFCALIEGSLIWLGNATSTEDSLAVMTLMSVIRDSASFGLGYGIVGFAENVGYLTSFGIYAMLMGVIALFGIPVYIWGAKLRHLLRVPV